MNTVIGARRRAWLAVSAVTSLALTAGAVHAQEEEQEEGWYGSTSIGYASTTGNAESSTLSAGVAVGLITERWEHTFTGTAFRATGESADTGEVAKTAERYQLGYQGDYHLNERSYLFGRVNFDRDLFSGIRRQVSETVGYGRTVLDRERHKLNLEAGAGAKQLKRNDGTELNEAIIRTGVDYTWAISENAEFTQRLFVEAGQENIFTESVSALKTNIVGNIAVSLSYTVRNNTDVAADALNTDTFTVISLQYDF
jgi:putative salt-induced outer membrane protein